MSVSGPKYCGDGDTAAAYVLRALPEDEAYTFELHLAGCARCQRDIHQLSAAADALFSVNSQGSGTVAVPGTLHGVHEILVTAEPLGGSLVPTSKVILEATTND